MAAEPKASASIPAPPISWRLSAESLADYLVEIGGTLVSYGCPSYRLEEVIRVVADIEGFTAQAFAIPTGLFVSVSRPGAAPVLRMVRVKEWGTNLDRLVAIDRIFNDVADRKTPIEEARRRLRALETHPPPYPRALQFVAAAVVAGAAAVFFRGGFAEVAVSAATGLVVGLLSYAMSKNPSGRFLVDFLGGFTAALLAWGFTRMRPEMSREVIVLAGVIALVPGMTLTTGLAELAQKNLVSGAARLMEAFVAFLSILFGIALAVGIEHMMGHDPGPSPARQGMPVAMQALALVAASSAFAIIFAVPRRFAWAAIASGAVGYVATALGTRHLPGHVSAFAAALSICLLSNAFARATQRPAQLFQLPGMMLLVPGSFGFLSLEDFLRGDFVGGASKGFAMMLIAGALVTGVLLANVLLPAKKLL